MDYDLYFDTAYLRAKGDHPDADERMLEALAHQHVHITAQNEMEFHSRQFTTDRKSMTDAVRRRFDELSLLSRTSIERLLQSGVKLDDVRSIVAEPSQESSEQQTF